MSIIFSEILREHINNSTRISSTCCRSANSRSFGLATAPCFATVMPQPNTQHATNTVQKLLRYAAVDHAAFVVAILNVLVATARDGGRDHLRGVGRDIEHEQCSRCSHNATGSWRGIRGLSVREHLRDHCAPQQRMRVELTARSAGAYGGDGRSTSCVRSSDPALLCLNTAYITLGTMLRA